MRKIILAAAAAAAVSVFGRTVDCEFAKIECPESWDPRTETKGFDVRVTLKDGAPLKEGINLNAHLHWMRVNGYGGFAKWMMPIKKPQVGKEYKLHYCPKFDEDLGIDRYECCVFLAPGDEYKEKLCERFVDIKIPPPPAYEAKPDSVTFKKSYIWIEEDPEPVKVGEELVLKVHYYLDPSDTWGPKQSKLQVTPLGPWIDNPDGVINKKRMHVFYTGLWDKSQRIDVGEHVAEFRFKLGSAHRYNACTFLCKFQTPDGKGWPWDYRGGGLSVVPTIDTFRLYPSSRGGMFYYDETPIVALEWGEKARGARMDAKAVVKDALGRTVLEKTVKVNPSRRGQVIMLPEVQEKGVFSLEVTIPDLKDKDGKAASDFCYFGRIPRFPRREGVPTPFGVTNVGSLDLSELAWDLGFSIVRHFTTWKGIEPAKGKWTLAALDRKIANNAAAGLKPWIQLHAPPTWTLPPGLQRTNEFEPAPFRLEDWGEAIDTLAKRYAGKLYGFEFLNEIVPGESCEDPVKTYVDICRVGYEAAKKNDPKLVCQLAGGLWPHSFRTDVLNAGVGKYVDVLPVHYSDYEAVREAQNDLAVRGITNVKVADNETARGYTIWNYPPAMAFSNSLEQCRWVMSRWPDELCAGADFICYFGGNDDACGNWSYMLDLVSPRPVAATLAVVQGKLAYAKPIGKFYIGETAAHLFEKDGTAILFLTGFEIKHHSVKVKAHEGAYPVVKVPAKGAVTVTDFQGNETKAGADGVQTGAFPVITEGGDLDELKLHASLFIGTAATPSALPQHVVEAAEVMKLPVKVSNHYAEKTSFALTAKAPGWAKAEPQMVELAPGETRTVELAYTRLKGAKFAAVNKLECKISAKGRTVVKPFVLFVTDESSLGNLVKNPGFDGDLSPWKGQGEQVAAPVPGAADNKALVLKGKGKGYVHVQEVVDLPVPGGTYLYSCWARGEGMGGGSNLDEYDDAMKCLQGHFDLQVFSIGGTGSKGWRYLSKKMTFRPDATKLAMVPVAKGNEGARILYDNVQLSLYKGSDYVAFASKDGTKASPIPLLCDNMIRAENGYAWDEKNLAGVARFTWDEKNLVFEATVEDDVLEAKPVVGESGEETLKGDSIALCIFPRLGADGRPENDQIRWYISNASPGGGSGTTTVYRPAKYSMGAKSGQLCKDSSVYQIDIRRESTLTTYRLVIPWSEIPGFTPAKGAGFGCNIVLGDSDKSAAFGKMVWGGGLKDDSADCGFVTLVP